MNTQVTVVGIIMKKGKGGRGGDCSSVCVEKKAYNLAHACVCTKQESSSHSLQVVHYTMGERTGTLDTIWSSEQTSTGHSDQTHGA